MKKTFFQTTYNLNVNLIVLALLSFLFKIGVNLFIQMLESIIFVIISYIGEFDFTLLFGMIVIRYLIKIMIGMIGLIPVYTIVKMKDK